MTRRQSWPCTALPRTAALSDGMNGTFVLYDHSRPRDEAARSFTDLCRRAGVLNVHVCLLSTQSIGWPVVCAVVALGRMVLVGPGETAR